MINPGELSEIKFTFIGKEKIKDTNNHKFKFQAVTVNKDLEKQPAKSIFEAYSKTNTKPEKSDEKGIKVKINEINSQFDNTITGYQGNIHSNINKDKENLEDNLQNELNHLVNESKKLKLESDKIKQKINELKESTQTQNRTSTSKYLFFFFI